MNKTPINITIIIKVCENENISNGKASYLCLKKPSILSPLLSYKIL
jgi:hypothetical protein